MIHPQKCFLVQKVLELVIGRLLEIRHALVSTENSEFFYFDELCYSEKITLLELDVPIPKFYYHDPPDRVKLRDEWFTSINQRKAKEAEERDSLEKRIKSKLDLKWNKSRTISDELYAVGSIEEEYLDQSWIILIQSMERGRQGKIRFRLAKYLYDEESRAKTKKQKEKKHHMELDRAVVIIQKIVRGFLARSLVRRLREEELELLGLKWTTPNEFSLRGKIQLKCLKDRERLEGFEERRRNMRRQNQKAFEEAQVTILNRLRLLEAPE